METTIYNKLVRDNIPKLLAEEAGLEVTFKAIKGEELQNALREKLMEEAKELVAAKTKEDMVEEMADLYEVLMAMHEFFEIPYPSAMTARRDKSIDKGSFACGYYLIRTEG